MKALTRIFKYAALLVFLYLVIAFITPFSKMLQNRSTEHQINYLLSNDKFDVEAQTRFPEGYVFFNSILALSIMEYSKSNKKQEYAAALDGLISKLLSRKASGVFSINQKLPNGAFYNGWVNFTLKQYIESDLFQNSKAKTEFIACHDSLSKLIYQVQARDLSILDSYPNSYWPADNLVCIASLPADASGLAEKWVELLKSTSQAELIHHDDLSLIKVRGSSQSLIIYLLSHIDLQLAIAEDKKFTREFKSSVLGIKFVCEDIADRSFEDVDSGPVVLGYGSVATIMNTKATKNIGQRSRVTEGFLNMLGLPINFRGQKFYIFKQEVMFDLFMLWSQV